MELCALFSMMRRPGGLPTGAFPRSVANRSGDRQPTERWIGVACRLDRPLPALVPQARRRHFLSVVRS